MLQLCNFIYEEIIIEKTLLEHWKYTKETFSKFVLLGIKKRTKEQNVLNNRITNN